MLCALRAVFTKRLDFLGYFVCKVFKERVGSDGDGDYGYGIRFTTTATVYGIRNKEKYKCPNLSPLSFLSLPTRHASGNISQLRIKTMPRFNMSRALCGVESY